MGIECLTFNHNVYIHSHLQRGAHRCLRAAATVSRARTATDFDHRPEQRLSLAGQQRQLSICVHACEQCREGKGSGIGKIGRKKSGSALAKLQRLSLAGQQRQLSI